MTEPPNWTAEQLAQDAEKARALFRASRLREPLDLYSRFFETFAPVVADLVDRLPALASEPVDVDVVADLVGDENLLTAFRYLAAPPVSDDDLKTLADTTLSAATLRSDMHQARRVRDTLLHIIDPHRFPWIAQGRVATGAERRVAVVATTALIAVRKVETSRRSNARKLQENGVKELLRREGFAEVRARDIRTLSESPPPLSYCGECKLGDTRADLIVRLADDRLAAIECKVSNSAVNSFKRINHETVSKARAWVEAFGRRQVLPIAVIGGVFKPANLETAQAEGLALIWSHRLDDLAEFVQAQPSVS